MRVGAASQSKPLAVFHLLQERARRSEHSLDIYVFAQSSVWYLPR